MQSNVRNDFTTDACPSPPREETENINFEQENEKYRPNDDWEEVSEKDKVKYKTKKVGHSKPKPTVQPNVININGSSGIHIGPNINIKIKNHDASSKTKEEIPMTESISKLLESVDSLKPEHLLYVAAHIGEGWKDIGRYLNLSEGQIDQFYEDHIIHGVKEVIYQILLDWLQNDPSDATFGKLGNVLWDCKQKDAVRRFARKYSV